MRPILVIAECCANWDRDPEKAFRMIKAAKECGADVAKFQWTSGPEEMQQRRGVDHKYAAIYRKYIHFDSTLLDDFKDYCDQVGIEFMCTVFLPRDIAVIAPLVKRFKVSAFESGWPKFVEAHEKYGREIIVSVNPADTQYPWYGGGHTKGYRWLHCISEYPTPVDRLQLNVCRKLSGFSDHSTSLITGGLAVAAGAVIIEKHIRLMDTDPQNPDYGHSLPCDDLYKFHNYVWQIREAQKAL